MNFEFSTQVHDYFSENLNKYEKVHVSKSILGSFDGLLASKLIFPDEVICIYTGEKLSTRQAMRTENKDYLMRLGEQMYVDAVKCPHILARYINDCINLAGYNAEFVKKPQSKLALVIATREIFPNEEIFCSYGSRYWNGSPIKPIRIPFKAIIDHRLTNEEDFNKTSKLN